MSKIFFFNIPFHGHVNPSLALAEELVKRGDEVIYYCTDSFKDKIQSTGAIYRSYGPKFYLDENFVTFDVTEIFKVHFDLSALIFDELLNDIRNDKPDLMIHDSLCPWAKYAAAVSNIPAVNTITTIQSPNRILIKILVSLFRTVIFLSNMANTREILKIKKTFQKKYGITVHPTDGLVNKEKLNLVYTSKEFQPESQTLAKGYKFVGPTSMYRTEPNSNFRFNKAEGKPLVYIAMGSIFNNNTDFYNQCFEAFQDLNVHVLMSVGRGVEISALTIPENFTVMSYLDIPQLEVLKKCDLFITHGGMNSTHEGLFSGVPLLVIPQQSEQGFVSQQVERTGCGIRLTAAQVNAELLKESAAKIFSNPSYRQNALKMRDSFIAAGGPKRAVDEILAYVKAASW